MVGWCALAGEVVMVVCRTYASAVALNYIYFFEHFEFNLEVAVYNR